MVKNNCIYWVGYGRHDALHWPALIAYANEEKEYGVLFMRCIH